MILLLMFNEVVYSIQLSKVLSFEIAFFRLIAIKTQQRLIQEVELDDKRVLVLSVGLPQFVPHYLRHMCFCTSQQSFRSHLQMKSWNGTQASAWPLQHPHMCMEHHLVDQARP